MNGTTYALTVRNVQVHDPIKGAAGYLGQVEIPLTFETAPGVAQILNRRFKGRTIAMTAADAASLAALQGKGSDDDIYLRVTYEGPSQSHVFESDIIETDPIHSHHLSLPADPHVISKAAQILDRYNLLTDLEGYFMMGLIEHGLAKDAGNGSRPIGRVTPILAGSVADLVEHDGRGIS